MNAIVSTLRARRSFSAVGAVLAALALSAVFAGWLAQQNPLDPAAIDILDAGLAPDWSHPFGTDAQGRDMLSAVLYGLRISLAVSVAAVAVSCILGSLLGAVAGALGGKADAAIMRAADLQLAFPALLIALLVEGAANAAFAGGRPESLGFWTVVLSIALSFWAQYARAVRSAALSEITKDYVSAARMSGMGRWRLAVREILPNVAVAIVPIAAVNFSGAIVAEATLSFLGVGMQPTTPSLGTLIRIGNDFLVSSEWWIAAFPAVVLAVLAVSANLFGDEIGNAGEA